MQDNNKFDHIFQKEPTGILLSQSKDQLPAIIESAFRSASLSIKGCLVNDKLLIPDLFEYINKIETNLLLGYSDQGLQSPNISIDQNYIVKLKSKLEDKDTSFLLIDDQSAIVRGNESPKSKVFFSKGNLEIISQLRDVFYDITA